MTVSDINPDYVTDYDGEWQNLGDDFNVKETHANSRYYIVKDAKNYLGESKNDQFINGDILVARWSTEAGARPTLFYDTNGATVDGIECSGETLKSAAVFLGVNEWGTALDCERGPRPTGKSSSPPAIILADSETGVVHVVVEESSSYPSFLYSVWTALSADSVDLAYSFHLESTVRLAEAVVTGIVNGETSGGGCFGLLRMFSETRQPYEDDLERASPFGEHPTGDTVEIQDLETIEAGVEINMNALLCLVWVMALVAVGIAWSICLKSSIGLDVYDRDELLRAVSLQGQASKDPTVKHSAIRIFVRREDSGNMTVFINDTGGGGEGGWRRFLKRGGGNDNGVVSDGDGVDPETGADSKEAAQLDDKFGGAAVPSEGTVSLGNSWSGTGRFLSASPVPSNAPTPAHGRDFLCNRRDVLHNGRDPFLHSPGSSSGGGDSASDDGSEFVGHGSRHGSGLSSPRGGGGGDDISKAPVVNGNSSSLDSRGGSLSPRTFGNLKFRPRSPDKQESKECGREEEFNESRACIHPI